MEPNKPNLHIFFFPLMAQGHIIPMVDIARLFAKQGVMASIVTTPVNASRFQTIINRAHTSGDQIQFLQLKFPSTEVGLPSDCENFDQIPSPEKSPLFLLATRMLKQPFEDLVQNHLPDVIVFDMGFTWMIQITNKFKIPGIIFHGTSCFSPCVSHALSCYKPHQNIDSNSQNFVVPGLPDPHIELTKAQLPEATMSIRDPSRFLEELQETQVSSYGVIFNSYEELENGYLEHYRKLIKKPAWPIGPVSLCNKEKKDKAERGKKAEVDQDWCLSWLDSKKPSSVIYISFGSACNIGKSQLLELGLGLEASGVSFVWVIRRGDVNDWLPNGFEERVGERGLVIKGWAPQILILSHWAIGGFLTHCGWNSVLECISVGLPMITWPLFAEQFFNEKLVVQVLRIGIGVGSKVGVKWGEEEKIGVLVKKEEVEKIVSGFMGGGEENEEVRKRAKKLGELARRAVEEGGSSYMNMALLIQDLMLNKAMKKEHHLV